MDLQSIAPTSQDIDTFQKIIGYAVDFPEAVIYLRDNRTAAGLVLTAQNMVPAKDMKGPREWTGFILIAVGFITIGFVLALIIRRK